MMVNGIHWRCGWGYWYCIAVPETTLGTLSIETERVEKVCRQLTYSSSRCALLRCCFSNTEI